ncbi:MAG: adaptor protein MecA [Acutalibacteraceae bacterium]|nr:adaptor protein MecA [Acutalibacteraceae bacterium]
MKVETLSKTQIKISLSRDEIQTFFGGYNLIDQKNPNSKKMLNLLLKEAIPDEDFPLDCKRVLIEVKPISYGCEILFTKLYNPNLKKIKRIGTLRQFALIFKSSNDLLDFARSAQKGEIIGGSLYIYEGQYALIINTPLEFERRLAHIGEYCKIEGSKTQISKIAEYGTAICKHDALYRLEFKEL